MDGGAAKRAWETMIRKVRGTTVVITGATSGIGRETALEFVKAGARVVVAGRREERLKELVAEIEARGGEALAVRTDVADQAQVESLIEQTIARFGRIDTLVNNAAFFGKLTPFDQIPEAEWDRVMAVNVKGLWLCSKAVIPTMRQQGKGKIINISSATIWMGMPLFLHYVASKGAVFAYTRALARELAGTGINVNAITPGYTMTEAALNIADPETVASFKRQLLDMQIIKRSEEPEDLTGTVVFLASDASDFITGQTLNVDGGLTHH
jgi:3-oxoacyl-[acyl-carrier protein] reductase